jgi:hypothetical protein
MSSVILIKLHVIYSHRPQTGKITSSHLNSGSFAEYTQHLLLAPKGYKCCQLIRLFCCRFTWRQRVKPHNFSYDSQCSGQDLNLRPSKHKPGQLIIHMYHLLRFILFTIQSSRYCTIRKWNKLPMFKTIFLFPSVSPCFLLVLVLFIILQTQLFFTLTMNQIARSSEMSVIYRILNLKCHKCFRYNIFCKFTQLL